MKKTNLCNDFFLVSIFDNLYVDFILTISKMN